MRGIPDPGFAGDDGRAGPGVAKALSEYDADPDASYAQTLAVLAQARLLVPVVAVPADGGAGKKTTEMATVLTRGADGRTALLAFSSTETLHRWDAQARPVPVALPLAARAAREDGAAALVVDLAGPVLFVVESPELHRLAAGEVPAGAGGRLVWVAATGGEEEHGGFRRDADGC